LRSGYRTEGSAGFSEILPASHKDDDPTVIETPGAVREGRQKPDSLGESDVWITLRVIQGQDAGAVFSPSPQTQTFTVGRGQKADFPLHEPNASREHFSIE